MKSTGGLDLKIANDNRPRTADTFASLEERRAWLETAPATHARHKGQPPLLTWAKREKDEITFKGMRLWGTLSEPPRMAANDNEPQDEDAVEAGEQPAMPNMDRELVDVSAKQLKYAADNGMVRFVGNRLVKVWNGHKWVSPDAEFGEVRQRKSDKADAENFDAEIPDVQEELARAMDAEKLRGRLGHKTVMVLDMALTDTLAEIGERLGFSGQYAQRMAGKEVRKACELLLAEAA